MKKLTGILIAAALILAPISASALEMMTDSSMKDVTGQAGVSIAVDDVVIFQESIADTTYWDTDGYSTYNNDLTVDEADDAAYGVMIDYADATRKLITIDAIVNESGSYAYTNEFLVNTFEDDDATSLNMEIPSYAGIDEGDGVSALSIDVGTARTLSTGKTYNVTGGSHSDYTGDTGVRIAGVVIGLPTVEIMQFHSNDLRSIKVTTGYAEETAGGAVNAGDNTHSELITIEKSGTSRMAILGGTVEIAPH